LNRTGTIEANIAHCLKVAYLTYRSMVHQLSLQEKPAEVPESKFRDFRSRNMIEKQLFFLDIIGRGEAFSKHSFQVSGVRLVLAFSLLTPDTRHPKPEGQCPIFMQCPEN